MDRHTVLAGDIGGTHARFALIDRSDPARWEVRHRLDLSDPVDSFAQALECYLDGLGPDRVPEIIALAVAGPVLTGNVNLTNRNWHISEDELRASGFAQAHLVNDFAALAWAAPHLGAADTRRIGPPIPVETDGPITILGAGTGFGVSCLARSRGRAVCLATEGGHIGFAPNGAEEIALLKALARRFGRVSLERILSGPGLENVARALDEVAGREATRLSAPEIVERAVRGDRTCHTALATFCAIFGAVAGDFALAHGARGGVLIAGGMAEKIEPYLLQGTFRSRFEDKGRLSSFVKAIPTRLLVNPDATLVGAARAAESCGIG
jgi:glucokinase